MLVTRIIFLSFQNDENLQLFTYCHSEKTENLASSVDFRLIQNLSMLIFINYPYYLLKFLFRMSVNNFIKCVLITNKKGDYYECT